MKRFTKPEIRRKGMQTARRIFLFLLAFSVAMTALPTVAQQVIATIPVGSSPSAASVDPVTNKIYVVRKSAGTVTVIDGATNEATATVGVGSYPQALQVNSVTNKIYVANYHGSNLTVIDGATLSTVTVATGALPGSVAVNPVTNKIYVANSGERTVTVIDGATNVTSTVTVGLYPWAVAINTLTNKIYATNSGDNTVTVIDGSNNSTVSVPAGWGPGSVAVNQVTNKIYVANLNSNTVTVIDGETLSTTTLAVGTWPVSLTVDVISNRIYVANYMDNTVTAIDGDTEAKTTIPVGASPNRLVANPVTNKIYVAADSQNSVTVIDGTTNSTVSVGVGASPLVGAVNSVTNRIYVSNYGGYTVSVIAGASSTALQFVAVTPCRVYDTRPQHGGNGPIIGGTSQSFDLPQLGQARGCGDLSAAVAYSLNGTAIPHGSLGYLSIWPTGEDQPVVSTMNSLDGRVKADAVIVTGGYQDAINIYVTDTSDVALDINGYFAPVSGQTLAFYPLTPCRVADTREDTYPSGLGPPQLFASTPRSLPVLESSCIPPGVNPQAYSFNFTVVPIQQHPVGYLSVWPTGQSQPVVSTLNDQTGTIVANAAIVPAGTSGDISVFATDGTQLLIDIDGYFAPAGMGGLSLYPAAPCRVIDTRTIGTGQPFNGLLSPPVDVVNSVCGTPNTAQAYIFNATVVPPGFLGYLALWPDGQAQPVVSTLNATDSAITSNMAIVPAGTNGKVDAFANGLTQLLLDISSYFAP
jgi:YVTN family beta-propeller protein